MIQVSTIDVSFQLIDSFTVNIDTLVPAGKARAFLQVFHKSGDAQAATYKAIEDTGYGYIGYVSSMTVIFIVLMTLFMSLSLALSIVHQPMLVLIQRIRRKDTQWLYVQVCISYLSFLIEQVCIWYKCVVIWIGT